MELRFLQRAVRTNQIEKARTFRHFKKRAAPSKYWANKKLLLESIKIKPSTSRH